MTATLTNTQLTDIQRFLLKNLAFMPEVPISAKDLFKFLGVNEELMLEFFEALHDLVPQWLEYKQAYYILHADKAQRILRELNPSIKDIYRIVEFFTKIFSEPEKYDPKVLAKYETYVLSLLRNIKQNSVTFADLHAAYGRYLVSQKKYEQAVFMYTQAISMTFQVQPQSPLIAEFYNELAFIFYQQDNFDKAIQFLEKALEQLKKVNKQLPEIQIKTHFLLGEILFRQHHYRQALTYYLRALENNSNATVTQARLRLATYLHSQIAECYRKLKDYDNALIHINKSEQLANMLPEKDRKLFKQQVSLQKQVITSLKRLNIRLTKLATYIIILGGILAFTALLTLLILFIIK